MVTMHGRKEHYRVYRHDSSKRNALIYNVRISYPYLGKPLIMDRLLLFFCEPIVRSSSSSSPSISSLSALLLPQLHGEGQLLLACGASLQLASTSSALGLQRGGPVHHRVVPPLFSHCSQAEVPQVHASIPAPLYPRVLCPHFVVNPLQAVHVSVQPC